MKIKLARSDLGYNTPRHDFNGWNSENGATNATNEKNEKNVSCEQQEDLNLHLISQESENLTSAV